MTKGTALVTGASAGIGEAAVRALIGDGWTVHMTARRGAIAARTLSIGWAFWANGR